MSGITTGLHAPRASDRADVARPTAAGDSSPRAVAPQRGIRRLAGRAFGSAADRFETACRRRGRRLLGALMTR
jgi:hypothetical protein